MTAVLREKAERLRRLHAGPHTLVLANAWDVASARLIAALGAPAIATSSAGVAYALGYADGQRIPRADMLDMIRRIAAAVDVPVTADVEGGYGTSADAAAETARGVIAAGAVGMNLEDAGEDRLLAAELHADRVRAARQAGTTASPPVAELERLGVRRVSVGSGIARAAYSVARRAAQELLERGTYGAIAEATITHADLQRLFGA